MSAFDDPTVPPLPVDEAGWDALVAGFEAGTLPWSGWRHPQHLAVTAWYVRRDGVAATYAALPGRIQAFNAAHGVATTLERGYHETMTRFWLALVAATWDAAPGEPLDRLAAVVDRLGDKQLPAAYWSAGKLGTWEARRGWVPPDLRPFPEAALLPPDAPLL